MARKMPSLSALRAFEAAARHLSFRKAADELNVTHSAVSHQVKGLEEQLGVVLFSRAARSVVLTEEGAFYYPILRDAFDRISDGTRFLTATGSPDSLCVQVYITVAMRWLVPRLHDFQQTEPGMQVRLSTSYLDWEFDRNDADVAILYVRKKQPDLHYVPLFDAVMYPVCAPHLMEGENAIQSPKDLTGHALLRVYTAPEEWDNWLNQAGVPELTEAPGPTFDSYILSLQAAIDGQGIALVNGPWAKEDIRTGRLVRPFDYEVRRPGGWCLVYRKDRKNDAGIRKFQNWLIQQLRNDADFESILCV